MPLASYLVKVIEYSLPGRSPWDLLWFCNVACLLLAAGLLFESWRIVSWATLMLLVALPGWFISPFVGQFLWTSTGVHIAAPLAGVIALRRQKSYISGIVAAIALFIALQAASRYLSPPELNINLAHFVYPELKIFFPELWIYEVANLSAFCGVAFVADRLLMKFVGNTAVAK